MKKSAVIIALLLFTIAVQAQKVEVKGNKIVVEGKEIAVMEKQGCGAFKPACTYYIRNFTGKTLITIVAMAMNDPAARTNENQGGWISYLRISFADGKGFAETSFNTKPKNIAQIIVKAQLIKDNELDENEVQNFIQAYGTRYSDRQKELNTNVIIIR